MKLIHISDLHIGKRVNEFSMLEDQEYILTKIINIVKEEKAEIVVIAGDIYDKSVPSAEAVQLFDDFLVCLSKNQVETFVISGNHDSAERIAFGSRLMNQSGVHMSPVYNKDINPTAVMDEHGELNIYMLPFIKPAHVRAQFPEKEITSYTQAIGVAIDNMKVDTNKRNILITHQFVTGAICCDSEDISLGGSDNVDAVVFEDFDYVALGHIHGPQKVGRDTIRYCGTPLKYSFSECNHAKSVTVVEIAEKGKISIGTLPLIPKRDMREIKGTYMDITARSFYEDTNVQDYIHATLTDEDDIPEAIGKLRTIYPNIMKIDYDNKRTRAGAHVIGASKVDQKSPLELFFEFYELQNNQSASEEQKSFVTELVEKIWEG